MSSINNIIQKYIFSKVSNHFGKEKSISRISISGIPFQVAKTFVEEISEKGGFCIYDRLIPILLTDKSVNNQLTPENNIAGVCGRDYVLNLRNNKSVDEIIVILGEGTVLDQSNKSSLIQIGISERSDRSNWEKEEMIQFILNEIFNEKGISFNDLKDELTDAISSYFNPSNSGPFVEKWGLLSQLSNEGKANVLGLLGLIKSSNSLKDLKKIEKIQSKLADSFDSSGLTTTFDELKLKTEDVSIKKALDEFKEHLLLKGCTSSYYKESPSYFYSTFQEDESKNYWWEALTLDIWQDLLDDSSSNEQGACKIEVLNPIFREANPCYSVNNFASFRIYHPDGEFSVGQELLIYNKRGKYELVATLEIKENSKFIDWEHTPNFHNVPSTYKVELKDHKSSTQKVICLDTFGPAFIFNVAQSENAASPRRKKARKNSKNKNEFWISTLKLANSGIHELEFLYRTDVLDIVQVNMKYGDNLNLEQSLSPKRYENLNKVLFEVEDECVLHFKFKRKDIDATTIHEINVLVSDSEPSGVKSFFEKLVLQNLSKKGAKEKVEVYGEWSHLHQIQNWMIGSPKYSWKPTILGMDYHDSIENFTQPDYLNNPIISNSEINIDFRPSYPESTIPDELVTQREDLIKELCLHGTEGSSYNLIEYLDLSKIKSERNLEEKVKNYIKQYLNWLDVDYNRAIWMDVLALCDSKRGTLDTSPFSVLLSPFHPIRLGWMLLCQSELSKNLEESIPCPVAGSLSPNSFPDSMLLPSYKNESHYSRTAFLSLEGSSYSWGVFWNSERLSDLSNEEKTKIFTDKFGVQIEGLDSGLSSSQIEHTISDVFKIKSGQTSLSVSVYSDSNETHNFNEGIKNWVGNNLGSPVTIDGKKKERDIWYGSTGKTLKVFDSRPLRQQPSSEELTNYSKETEFGLQWYDSDIEENNKTDLTIVSQLSNQSPVTHRTEFKSVLFGDGISRARIRFPTVNNYNKLNYTESRTCQEPKRIKDSLGGILERACYFVEKEVFDSEKGSLSSTPKLSFIDTQLESSDYCAISSSVIDPTAFFDGENSYLWDYDLPKYSIKQNCNSGFYLLARKSDSVFTAVKNSLSAIKDIGHVGIEIIGSILKEISGRGIPTLKTLASGGANASGELGMLIGMNILQGFDNEMKNIEVFPQKNLEKDEYNIIIPVDPFKNQINSLYDRFKLDRKRPDLLVVNIKGSEDIEVSITPIEIKFRTSTMKKDDLKSAHNQCVNMLELFNILDQKAQTSQIWDVARGKLLTEMLSFGFSIYGRRIKSQDDRIKWTKLQQKVLSLISEPFGVNYNTQGKLIVISDYTLTSLESVQGHPNDTLLLALKDAVSLIKRDNLEQFIPLKEKLQDWVLVDISEKKFSPEKENNPESSEIDEKKAIEGAFSESSDQHELEPENKQDEIDNKNVITTTDSNNVGLKFVVGNQEGILENIPQYFHPSNTNLNQINIGIVGDLGTGKTQLLKALIHNCSVKPSLNRGKAPKFLILDTKRDYGEGESNKELLKTIKAKNIRPYRMPLNVFDLKGSEHFNPKIEKAYFFVDILEKIYSGIGAVQRTNLLEAIDIAFDEKGYVVGGDYSKFISPTIKDVFEAYQTLVKKADTPYSIMSDLVRMEIFESHPAKTVSFKDYFDSSLVVSLGDIANLKSPLKVALVIFLNLYQEYMLSVEKKPYLGNSPQLRNIDSFILIDEAKLIMDQEFQVLEDLLRKGREFGVGVVLSSQYLGDFKSGSINYGEALATWFIHKVPNLSDKELSQIGISNSEGLANKVKQLAPHYCLYKSGYNSHQIIRGIPYYQLLNKGD